MIILPSGTTLPARLNTEQIFDATPLATSASATSTPSTSDWARTAVLVIESAGSNVAVSLEGSVDGGATWYEIEAHAAGLTGRFATAIADPLVRVLAVNESAVTPHDVTAYLTLAR